MEPRSWRRRALCVAGFAMFATGCADRADDAGPEASTTTEPGPTSADYTAAWIERLADFDDDDPAVGGAEACIAAAVVRILPADVHHEAGVDPDHIARGLALRELPISGAEEGDLGDALVACDLAGAFAGSFGDVVGFVSAPQAACTAAEVVRQPTYPHLMARWILGDDRGDWLGGIAELFEIGLRECPDAYVSLTLGGIEREVGPLPPEGAQCLDAALRGEIDALLARPPDVADAALGRVLETCETALGEAAELLLG